MPVPVGMTSLSENFTLEELARTCTGAPNEPDDRAREKLLYLANFILQPIRDRWGKLYINSGYRSPAVNQRVGGSDTSQHCDGEAADLITLEAPLQNVYRWIVEDSRLAFGQCIFELRATDWIHVSLPRIHKPNHEALVSPEPGRYIRFTGRFA